MNKQGKLVNGKVVGGIEWTKTVLPDGTERQGYTWNPIAGCFHACQWEMPDGSIANCYAEDVADNLAQKTYPEGFEHHYWKPQFLYAPAQKKAPSRIFCGSMADVFGHWVDGFQISEVLRVCAENPQHTFQFLTKNPARVRKFEEYIPTNCWIGASVPPTHMWNKKLSQNQIDRMFRKTISELDYLHDAGITTWMSIEPLSFDAGPTLAEYGKPVDWIVIGAASNGRKYYQPKPHWVNYILLWADSNAIPVFFKGNLEWPKAQWREDFPNGA